MVIFSCSAKPKKKQTASKPRLVDRIKEKVVGCAAGDTTSAFVTDKGQLFMFGQLAAPFDNKGKGMKKLRKLD